MQIDVDGLVLCLGATLITMPHTSNKLVESWLVFGLDEVFGMLQRYIQGSQSSRVHSSHWPDNCSSEYNGSMIRNSYVFVANILHIKIYS